MNYIHKLQKENAELRKEREKFHEGISWLRCYLLSEKFHVDTTVQTSDVLRRLEEAKAYAENERKGREMRPYFSGTGSYESFATYPAVKKRREEEEKRRREIDREREEMDAKTKKRKEK